MGNLIYFQPPGINPKFCEVGMFIEGDTEHIYYLHDPCKIHKDEVVIIPEENVINNFRKREYRIKTEFKPNKNIKHKMEKTNSTAKTLTEYMVLNENNLEDWKKELNSITTDLVPPTHKYSDCLSDEEWLKDYKGSSTLDVRDLDISYGE